MSDLGDFFDMDKLQNIQKMDIVWDKHVLESSEWTGLMYGFTPAPTDQTTTNSGDVGGSNEAKPTDPLDPTCPSTSA